MPLREAINSILSIMCLLRIRYRYEVILICCGCRLHEQIVGWKVEGLL